MFKKIGEGILKYKNIILFVIAIVFAISVVGTVFLVTSDTKINSDVASYLDEDSATKKGLTFLKEEFDIRGYASFVVRVDENNEGEKVLSGKIDKLLQNDKITTITWYGTLSQVDSATDSLSDMFDTVTENEDYLKAVLENISASESISEIYAKEIADIKNLLNIVDALNSSGKEDEVINTVSMKEYLRQPTSKEGVYDYVLLFMLKTDGVDEESYALLDSIKQELSYTSYASSGTIESGQRLLSDTMKDLPWFILAGVLIVLIILFVSTSSYLEPLIMLVTLLAGIVISMGINYLFPSISIISFALSAVLQLAITMDYAVFYSHLYRKNRKELLPKDAMIKTWPEATGSILASCFTTVGGFGALYCMRFGIGTDMANVLIKGILLSMITVLTVQPILTVILDKQILSSTHDFLAKLHHKFPKINLSKENISHPIARFSVWARIVLVIIAVGLIVPSFLGQSNVPFTYLQLYEKETETEEQILSNELGNQLIIAVPFEITKKGGTHADFIKDIEKAGNGRIGSIMSAFTVTDIDDDAVALLLEYADQSINTNDIKAYLTAENLELFGVDVPEAEPGKKDLEQIVDDLIQSTEKIDVSAINSYFRKVDDKWYTLYAIGFTGDAEDAEAQQVYANIMSVCNRYFGSEKTYAIGMVISGYEMAQITPGDFLRVTLVSAGIIFIIVLLLLRNPLKSLIIVTIIELGIWINLSFSYLFGESINFIVYIIISSIELGCTVDYAILFANTFENNRKNCVNGKECAILSASQSMPAYFVGALMISAVCFSMYLISSNIIIKQLVGFLARGAVISFVLVAVLMTAIWSFFPVKRKEVDYQAKMKKLEEKIGEAPSNENKK